MPPISGDALANGTLLHSDNYRVEACLGRGGFGITYRAHDHSLDRSVALKEFFPSACVRTATGVSPGGGWTQASLDAFKAKFLEEGRLLARLRHPGIPHVYSVFEENGTAYLVMEYIEGQTLEAYLEARGGRLPVDEALALIRKAGEALEVVHAASLLHRDIKPSNLMLRSDGQMMLIDFGAAREFVPDAVYNQSQTVILTPGYAPLEQYSRSGKRGVYTDIYALAATLYHLLTGERPVEATDRASGDSLPSPRALRSSVPPTVSEAVLAGLRLRAEERPQTVKAFLAAFPGALVQPASPPPKPVAAPLPRPKPSRTGSVFSPFELFIVVVAVVVMGGWGVWTIYSNIGSHSASGSPGEISSGVPSPSPPPRFIASDRTKINAKDGAEMIFIPAGDFLMGDDDLTNVDGVKDNPRHRVTLSGYWIYKNLVTVGMYKKFCHATGRKMPEVPEWGWKDNHPMVNVNWKDAKSYCDWAKVRLPTEAEWEKAARGTDGRLYPWGNVWDGSKCANSVRPNKLTGTTPVGSYPGGASPYGVLDMSGNVWEWCSDWFDLNYMKSSPRENPTGPTSGDRRVLRGGAWFFDYVFYFRSSFRYWISPEFRFDCVGFRCAAGL